MQATYGEERKELFQCLTVEIGNKHTLRGLSLEQINEIVTIEDPKTKLEKSIQYGDFPAFYQRLSGALSPDIFLVRLVLKTGRDFISLAMLQDMSNFYRAKVLIEQVLASRCTESARYLLNNKDLATLLEMNGPGEYGAFPIKNDDLIWALEKTTTIISVNFVFAYAKLKPNTDRYEKQNPKIDVFQLLLDRLTKPELDFLTERYRAQSKELAIFEKMTNQVKK